MPKGKVSVRAEVDEQIHREAKAAAALQGKTLAEVIRQALIDLAANKPPKEGKRKND